MTSSVTPVPSPGPGSVRADPEEHARSGPLAAAAAVTNVTGTQWPWMLPPGTPGTPVRDRRRERGLPAAFLAALLARWRGRGRHRIPPAVPVPPPRVPEPAAADDWGVPRSMMTLLDEDLRAARQRPYADPPGTHRRPR